MPPYDYDLLVIGSGPAGQRGAIQAAKLGKRVMVVERKAVVGGVCINTVTIPRKTLREAVLYFSGYRLHEVYGESYAVKQNVTITDLLFRTDHVIRHEIDVTRHQLSRNHVELFNAEASFVDPHTVRLNFVDAQGFRDVRAAFVVLAPGTHATRDPHIPFDGRRIFASDDILHLDHLPRSLAVVGAGVIGSLYAGHLASVAEVSILTRRDEHARALADGLRISGKSDLTARVQATADPAELPGLIRNMPPEAFAIVEDLLARGESLVIQDMQGADADWIPPQLREPLRAARCSPRADSRGLRPPSAPRQACARSPSAGWAERPATSSAP